MEMFAVRLTDEVRQQLKTTAKYDGKTVSEIVRQAIQQLLEQRQQVRNDGK